MQPETDPDASWVQHLTGASLGAARRAIREAANAKALYRHLERAHEEEGREGYVEIDAPLELHALVRLRHPVHVLEVGVSSGVSSAYLLDAMNRNDEGTLHSIDLPSHPRGGKRPRVSWSLPPGRSSGWAVPLPLRKRWDLRLGDKRDVLPILGNELRRIDLVVYDVPHRDVGTRKELRALDPRLPIGSIVIVDHGPGGEACSALRSWSEAHDGRMVGRRGLGLYGARKRARGRRT